jgi:predicted nucleic acid-binding protein
MVKTEPIVIADAGPVIHLDELGCLYLLADFGTVMIPETVWMEVQRHRPLSLASVGDWLVLKSPRQSSPVVKALTPLFSLHAGNCLLLTDDTAARLAAKSLSIAAHGTLGLLIRAIRRQCLTKAEVLVLLREVPHRTTLHIRPALLAEVIADVEANLI